MPEEKTVNLKPKETAELNGKRVIGIKNGSGRDDAHVIVIFEDDDRENSIAKEAGKTC